MTDLEKTVSQLLWKLYDNYAYGQSEGTDTEYEILKYHYSLAKKLNWDFKENIRTQMKYYEDPSLSVLNGTGWRLAP